MFGQKIPFDPDVKLVIDKGVKESRLMDPEKRAEVIETAGCLAYDIMIVESLGDHEDAEVAKGAKQAAENCIKKRLEETKYSTVEEEAFDQEAIGFANLLMEAKEAAENYQEMRFDEGKPLATEPLKMMLKETSKRKASKSNTSSKRVRMGRVPMSVTC